jgi:hypothetical protein
MEARYPGDPRGRLARAFCAVSATGSIRRRRDELIDKAIVCSFDGNSHEVDTLSAGDMLREKFNLHHGQYQLVKHFPEQFFIVFSDPRSKQWALDRRSVSFRGRIFHFGDWSEDSYARKTNFEFRVKVRVEGIPVHCWGDEVASKALGKSCAIHYVQERTRRRERTRSFDLWAWCSDPCDIPKEVMLSVLEPDRELPPVISPLPLVGAQHDAPADLKPGHVYTLRNHIEVVEDLSFLRGRGARGGPPNRKQRREFVWSYGAPDSMGEKRERTDDFRGRETVRRDWDHDDDYGDFQRNRRSGNRRHRSLSGWARSSRCRGGMDDCYSSNDKHRRSTPSRRHGWGMTSSSRWVPKAKVRAVSFADPIVTAVWPQVDCHGRSKDVGGKPGSLGAVSSTSALGPSTTTRKVPHTVRLANVFTTIHNSLDSVLHHPSCGNLLNLSTTILANPPEPQPIEFSKDSELFTFQNCSDSALVVGPGVNLGTTSAAGCLEPNRTFVNQDTDRITSIADLTVSADSDFQAPLGASPALGSESHPQLLDFIADITHTPEPPLISAPPKRHNLKLQKQSITKRSSARLAAKQRFKSGKHQDAISTAQKILLAKLNNSAAIEVARSSSSNRADFDDSLEQMASIFTKPLPKKHMEAILELINQDIAKTTKNKKKGRKVTPALKAGEVGDC